ncbi:MAG: hypothetical protein AAFO79_03450 [Pseudomonadota bacterium]
MALLAGGIIGWLLSGPPAPAIALSDVVIRHSVERTGGATTGSAAATRIAIAVSGMIANNGPVPLRETALEYKIVRADGSVVQIGALALALRLGIGETLPFAGQIIVPDAGEAEENGEWRVELYAPRPVSGANRADPPA